MQFLLRRFVNFEGFNTFLPFTSFFSISRNRMENYSGIEILLFEGNNTSTTLNLLFPVLPFPPLSAGGINSSNTFCSPLPICFAAFRVKCSIFVPFTFFSQLVVQSSQPRNNVNTVSFSRIAEIAGARFRGKKAPIKSVHSSQLCQLSLEAMHHFNEFSYTSRNFPQICIVILISIISASPRVIIGHFSRLKNFYRRTSREMAFSKTDEDDFVHFFFRCDRKRWSMFITQFRVHAITERLFVPLCFPSVPLAEKKDHEITARPFQDRERRVDMFSHVGRAVVLWWFSQPKKVLVRLMQPSSKDSCTLSSVLSCVCTLLKNPHIRIQFGSCRNLRLQNCHFVNEMAPLSLLFLFLASVL